MMFLRRIILILLASLIGTIGFIGAVGTTGAAKTIKPEESGKNIRLIIDISGSMKKNDPQNLRIPAVNLLVNILPKGTHAGVWTFGQYVNDLIPFQKVNQTWKKTRLGKVTK
ncbi:MAG: VWA domain-containing protein [Pseudomonadales bacterium]|nr:VWA domain-containing protein [Pseudomonadales bacterium]